MLILLIATNANSALRDAQIGLSLLWVAMVYLRLAQEPGDPGARCGRGALDPEIDIRDRMTPAAGCLLGARSCQPGNLGSDQKMSRSGIREDHPCGKRKHAHCKKRVSDHFRSMSS